MTRLESHADYCAHLRAEKEISDRRLIERTLASHNDETFTVPGTCFVCQKSVPFYVDYSYADLGDAESMPNWREHLLCPGCHLNNRMRATIHLFEGLLTPTRDSAIFLTEQMTPLFTAMKKRYPTAVGSEYLGDRVPFGESDASGIRNESVTQLTFPDASFDFVISLEVFEHVPDFRQCFRECRRVLKADGSLLFTVPFDLGRPDNLVRAVVDEAGEIQHLLPPEYHGDPLNDEGCLAFYRFGWELLDQVREAGFDSVTCYTYWSRHFGYLGANLSLFIARKSG